MKGVYGYRMAHEQADQLNLWFLFKSAIDHRAPVRVSYFKRKTENHKPVNDKWGNPVYVKVTRVVEPYQLTQTDAGHHIVRVVDRTPEGSGSRPAYRSIRLDHVAIRYADGGPLLTRLMTHSFLCPSPLDGEELYPTKGELVSRKRHGILLTA